jgi:lipid-binding SYLF domain-containing protein
MAGRRGHVVVDAMDVGNDRKIALLEELSWTWGRFSARPGRIETEPIDIARTRNKESAMKTQRLYSLLWISLLMLVTLAACQTSGTGPTDTSAAARIDRDVDTALDNLYGTVPEARILARRAKGILVFPGVVKAGFIGGAQYGKGALRQRGRTTGYYNLVAGSYGLQAGVQSFDYAMFFMTQDALDELDRREGFEIGAGPSVVLVDAGMARSLTTTTLQHDVYAFIFGQRGLMAGLGLQGSKITRINP